MSKIAIDTTSCVRFRSVRSECVACADACESDAIVYEEGGIRVINSLCTECYACLPVCPSSAVVSSSADTLGFAAVFLDSDDSELSCDLCGFCIRAFDAQTLLTLLTLKKTDISVVLGGCEKCASCESMEPQFAELNLYAKVLGLENRFVPVGSSAKVPKGAASVDRRGFFAALRGKNLVSAAKAINEASKEDVLFGLETIDFTALRAKKLPTAREGLLSVISSFLPSDEQLAPLFFTDKLIDESCTNCQLCYNLCPTGALSVARLKNAINFESYKCIKCKLCEDVCETKSIHSLPVVDLQNFVKKSKLELIKFRVTRCYSCGAIYTPDEQNDGACPRCAKEDEDAMELSAHIMR